MKASLELNEQAISIATEAAAAAAATTIAATATDIAIAIAIDSSRSTCWGGLTASLFVA